MCQAKYLLRVFKSLNYIEIIINTIKQLVVNPYIIGIAGGLFFRQFNFQPEGITKNFLDTIIASVTPLALFSLGMALNHYGVRGQIKASIMLVGLKLMFMPFLVLVIAYFIELPTLTLKIAILTAALPVGINAWLVAEQFKTGQRLAATSISMGTVTSLVTIGFWFWLIEQLAL